MLRARYRSESSGKQLYVKMPQNHKQPKQAEVGWHVLLKEMQGTVNSHSDMQESDLYFHNSISNPCRVHALQTLVSARGKRKTGRTSELEII